MNPSMCRGGARHRCSTSLSMFIMSCGWGTWNHLWYGAASCIRHLQGFRLYGGLHSCRSPCPTICRRLKSLSQLSGWYVHCLLQILGRRAPPCRNGLSLGRRCPVAANPLAGSVSVQKRLLPGLLTGLLSMQLDKAETSTLTMAVEVLLSLLTHKTELIVRGVYGAGETQCIALLAAFFALRGHRVYYAAREKTPPLSPWPPSFINCCHEHLTMNGLMRSSLVSQPQARTSEETLLDARNTDKN